MDAAMARPMRGGGFPQFSKIPEGLSASSRCRAL
jgi:hypothetical protein